jgi:hypothetical protein
MEGPRGVAACDAVKAQLDHVGGGCRIPGLQQLARRSAGHGFAQECAVHVLLWNRSSKNKNASSTGWLKRRNLKSDL